MKVQFSMKWARIALFCFLELLSRQIVYRDNCWRNIFNCWRRVGQKLLKNWSKREGVFLFRLRVFLFCHSERSEESEYITSAFFRYAQQLVRSFAMLRMTWCLVLIFLGLKIHCTHCTGVVIRWISMLPSDMCLFFSCHWCHFRARVTWVTFDFCPHCTGKCW